MEIKSKHVFIFLAVFWSAWLYTEISEYYARQDDFNKINEFIHRGDRFTKDDGKALEARLQALEELERVEHSRRDRQREGE